MSSENAAAHFGSDGSSAAAARRFISGTLGGWKRTDLEEAAVLLVSELVGNAVLHAGTEIDVAVSRAGDRLRIEVADGSSVLPERKHYSVTSATGRGLALVERLSTRWGVERSGSGKTVWFELDDPVLESEPSSAAAFGLDDWDDPGIGSMPPSGGAGTSSGRSAEQSGARADPTAQRERLLVGR